MRDLRKEIRKINEEIEKEDLNTKNPIFNICTKDSQICKQNWMIMSLS